MLPTKLFFFSLPPPTLFLFSCWNICVLDCTQLSQPKKKQRNLLHFMSSSVPGEPEPFLRCLLLTKCMIRYYGELRVCMFLLRVTRCTSSSKDNIGCTLSGRTVERHPDRDKKKKGQKKLSSPIRWDLRGKNRAASLVFPLKERRRKRCWGRAKEVRGRESAGDGFKLPVSQADSGSSAARLSSASHTISPLFAISRFPISLRLPPLV